MASDNKGYTPTEDDDSNGIQTSTDDMPGEPELIQYVPEQQVNERSVDEPRKKEEEITKADEVILNAITVDTEQLPNNVPKTPPPTYQSAGQGSMPQHPITVARPIYTQKALDEKFDYHHEVVSFKEQMKQKARNTCHCSLECVKNFIFGFMPILHWLPTYQVKNNLASDIIAGLTVGIMHIPQGMGYATLAGLNPIYGLYTSFFSNIFYVPFGTSPHISMGPFAVASLIVGATRYNYVVDEVPFPNSDGTYPTIDIGGKVVVSSEHAAVLVATTLSFLAGIIQIVMGMVRLGFLSVFLSDELVGGFTTAAAIFVFTAQVDKALGIKINRYNGPFKLYYIYRDVILNITHTNVATVTICLICMVIIYLFKEYLAERVKRIIKMPFPIDLVVLVACTLLSQYIGFEKRWGVKVVNTVPKGMPAPTIPLFALLPDLIADAFGLAVICYAISISMAKIFAKRFNYKVDPTQELYAYGFANTAASFFGAYAAGASLSRSSVNASAGSKTCLSAWFACIIIFVVLMWIGPFFEPLPMCALSAIIMVALKGLFLQVKELCYLWPISKIDFSIWLVAFLATAILDVKFGLLISIGYTVITLIFRAQCASASTLGRLPGTEVYGDLKRYGLIENSRDIKIFRYESPIFYGNAELFREKFYELCELDLAELKATVQAAKDEKNEEAMQARRQTLAEIEATLPPKSGFAKLIDRMKASCGGKSEAAEKLEAAVAAASRNMSKKKSDASAHNVPTVDMSETTTPEPERKFSFKRTYSLYSNYGNRFRMNSMRKKSLPKRPKVIRGLLPCAVIIDMNPVGYLDCMGVGILKQINSELNSIGVPMFLAGCRESVLLIFESIQFYKVITQDNMFPTTSDALEHIRRNYKPNLARTGSVASTANSVNAVTNV